MDSYDICRVCMEEVENFSSLFEPLEVTTEKLTPASLISQCSGVSVSPNDGLPELVCCSCLQSVLQACAIREKCIASDRKLRKILFFRSGLKPSQSEETQLNTPEIVERTDEEDDALDDREWITEANSIKQEVIAVQDSTPFTNEVEYTEREAYDLGSSGIKLELATTFCDEEYLEEDVRVLNEEDNSETIPYEVQTQVDEGTIKIEVEIVDQPLAHTNVLENDYVDDSTVKDQKKYRCDLCKQAFTTKGNLKGHMMLHSNEKPYVCDICGRKFAKKGNYKVHRTRHSNNRVHPCTVCDMSFICHVNLKNHMRKHSGVRSFACLYCSKTFIYLADKRRHEFLHTGEHPFSCDDCDKKFTRAVLLRKHLKNKCKGRQENSKAPKQKKSQKVYTERRPKTHAIADTLSSQQEPNADCFIP